MKIIDTHAHYSHRLYNHNREELFNEMFSNDVKKIVEVGTNTKSILKTMQLLSLNDNIYGGIGYFPCDVLELENNKSLFTALSKQLLNEKVVYLGEIGLDYHWKTVSPELQEKWFRKQIELSIELNKPICIHSREAEKDTIKILKDYPEARGIVHCFAYGPEAMEFFVENNFYIGVGGTITYSSNKNTRKAIEMTPIDKIVTETDAPFLTPHPYRKDINNSKYIELVINEIAKLKKENPNFIEEKVYKNSFNILKFV